jgi:hypothetical protein
MYSSNENNITFIVIDESVAVESVTEVAVTEVAVEDGLNCSSENVLNGIYPEIVDLYEDIKEPILNMDNSIHSAPIQLNKTIPKLIFVVPYRDRWEQYQFFDDHMRTRVLAGYRPEEYLILYAHQTDDRSFNRGAMKNIGFLAGKEMFPEHYKNITFVFNDIDTMPYVKNFLNYETWPGNVKHFYGYKFALGGIVSICGGDFEKVNGYPNLFSWSSEDNTLQLRVLEAGLKIDRSQFYPIMDKHILQNKDGLLKVINRTEHDRVRYGSKEGISNLLKEGGLKYDYVDSTGFVNVKSFSTGFEYNTATDKVHNIADGTKMWKDSVKVVGKRRGPGMLSMQFQTR